MSQGGSSKGIEKARDALTGEDEGGPLRFRRELLSAILVSAEIICASSIWRMLRFTGRGPFKRTPYPGAMALASRGKRRLSRENLEPGKRR